MKCFSIGMSFDPFNKLLNSEMFYFFYNCVGQSWYSEINFVLLFLIHQYGSPRTCWVCDFIMFLLIKSVAIKLGTFLDFLLLSTYGSPCT